MNPKPENQIDYVELPTSATEHAKRFYGDVFGFTTSEHEGEATNYVELQRDGTAVAGMMPKPKDAPAEMPPCWGVYFAVADTDATVAKVAALGGATLVEPMDIAPGRFAVCADSLGAIFNVIALPAT